LSWAEATELTKGYAETTRWSARDRHVPRWRVRLVEWLLRLVRWHDREAFYVAMSEPIEHVLEGLAEVMETRAELDKERTDPKGTIFVSDDPTEPD
jgi:hypothetical protein